MSENVNLSNKIHCSDFIFLGIKITNDKDTFSKEIIENNIKLDYDINIDEVDKCIIDGFNHFANEMNELAKYSLICSIEILNNDLTSLNNVMNNIKAEYLLKEMEKINNEYLIKLLNKDEYKLSHDKIFDDVKKYVMKNVLSEDIKKYATNNVLSKDIIYDTTNYNFSNIFSNQCDGLKVIHNNDSNNNNGNNINNNINNYCLYNYCLDIKYDNNTPYYVNKDFGLLEKITNFFKKITSNIEEYYDLTNIFIEIKYNRYNEILTIVIKKNIINKNVNNKNVINKNVDNKNVDNKNVDNKIINLTIFEMNKSKKEIKCCLNCENNLYKNSFDKLIFTSLIYNVLLNIDHLLIHDEIKKNINLINDKLFKNKDILIKNKIDDEFIKKLNDSAENFIRKKIAVDLQKNTATNDLTNNILAKYPQLKIIVNKSDDKKAVYSFNINNFENNENINSFIIRKNILNQHFLNDLVFVFSHNINDSHNINGSVNIKLCKFSTKTTNDYVAEMSISKSKNNLEYKSKYNYEYTFKCILMDNLYEDILFMHIFYLLISYISEENNNSIKNNIEKKYIKYKKNI